MLSSTFVELGIFCLVMIRAAVSDSTYMVVFVATQYNANCHLLPAANVVEIEAKDLRHPLHAVGRLLSQHVAQGFIRGSLRVWLGTLVHLSTGGVYASQYNQPGITASPSPPRQARASSVSISTCLSTFSTLDDPRSQTVLGKLLRHELQDAAARLACLGRVVAVVRGAEDAETTSPQLQLRAVVKVKVVVVKALGEARRFVLAGIDFVSGS